METAWLLVNVKIQGIAQKSAKLKKTSGFLHYF
jgi:hypothetical protein